MNKQNSQKKLILTDKTVTFFLKPGGKKKQSVAAVVWVSGRSQGNYVVGYGQEKGKVKCLTFPFEVQSSIDAGRPRKESQQRRQLGEKKNELHNVLLMSSSPLWETQI